MLTKEEKITFSLVGILLLLMLIFLVMYGVSLRLSKPTKIIIDWNSPQFIGERSGKYSTIFGQTKLDEEVPDSVKEEFTVEKEDFAIAHSNAELIRLYGISFKENTLSDLAIECNTKLFDMCNKYFLATYGGQQVSPMVPMAISNLETPGRADQSVTYCALFPSKLVPISSADQISNMSCLAVLESPQLFSVLASDHWTRDRGALQMNPTYGTEYDSFNSLMGPSEAEILNNIQGTDIDLSMYVAYEPRNNRNITGEEWLAQVSTAPGDRFSVKDSLLRLASAVQSAIDQYSDQHQIENDYEMMTLIAMAHNAGSVWNKSYHGSKIGNWRSGAVAYRYCKQITSDEFIHILKGYCNERLKVARESGKSVPMTLDRKDARALFDKGYEEGIFDDYRTYVYEGRYYEVTYCYPIQALYNYMMLGMVYSGN